MKVCSVIRTSICLLACASLTATMVPSAALGQAEQSDIEVESESIDAASTPIAGTEADVDTSAESQSGDLLVVYKKRTTKATVKSDVKDEGVAPQKVEMLNNKAAKVEVSQDEQVDDLIDALEDDSNIAYAQRNYTYYLMEDSDESSAETNDPRLSDQYYLNSWDETFSSDCGANIKAAWGLTEGGASVTVATLDTGALSTHEDLAGNLDMTHAIDLGSGGEAGSVTDSDGHGTHVAGIIAGVADNSLGISGVSRNTKVLPVNVFYAVRSGFGPFSQVEYTTDSATLLKGFSYLDGLVESGELSDLRVINMSLGNDAGSSLSKDDTAVQSAITEMRTKHNVLSVCAGGNGDNSGNALTGYTFPADYEDSVSVTSLNEDGTNTRWSDYNQYKDISAPGVDILSTYSTSNSTYKEESGTSMSAPIVSGILAMVYSVYPDITADQAVAAIKSTAHKVNSASNDHSVETTTTVRVGGVRGGSYMTVTLPATGSAGAIDAAAAVQYAKELAAEAAKEQGSADSGDQGGSGASGDSSDVSGDDSSDVSGDDSSDVSGDDSGSTEDADTPDDPADNDDTSVLPVGSKFVVGKNTYKVTSSSNKTVALFRFVGNSGAKKAKVCSKVTMEGVAYKVVAVSKRAYAGFQKLSTLTIASATLSKSGLCKSLAGSKIKTVKLTGAAVQMRAKYKKWLKKSNSGKTITLV